MKLQGIGEKTQDARVSSLEELELQISNKIASDPVVESTSTNRATLKIHQLLVEPSMTVMLHRPVRPYLLAPVTQEILHLLQNTAHANPKRSSGLIGNAGLLQVILMIFLALKGFLPKSGILELIHSASSMLARNESSRLFLTHCFPKLISLMTQKLR